MKCPSCGAETNSAKYCEYCGSELPKNNSSINITNNYYGNATASTEQSSTGGKCPMCNSTNIKFHRERTGSVGNAQSYKSVFTNTRNNRSSTQNTYQTIGLCQNCGHTWNPAERNISNQPKSKSKGCLWWFLAILFFPVSLSVWFYKTDKVKLEKKWKTLILVAFWIVMIIYSNATSENPPTENTGSSTETTTGKEDSYTPVLDETQNSEPNKDTQADSETTESENAAVYDEFQVIDTFIEKYNATAATPMTEPVIIDISNKDSEHYRTEYRTLNNALAKQCKIGDATIDIVSTKDFLSGSNIRIYLHTESVDFAGEVFSTIVKLVYPEITDNELSDARNQLNQDSSSSLNDIVFYYIQSYNELFMDNVMYAE